MAPICWPNEVLSDFSASSRFGGYMNDINEIVDVAPIVHGSRPTLHLKNSAPNAPVRVRSGIARGRPVRIFPRKDFDHPKSAAFASSDATSRPADWT
jgi:hypothetical protein